MYSSSFATTARSLIYDAFVVRRRFDVHFFGSCSTPTTVPWWHTARWHFKGLYAVEQFGLEVNVSKTQILYQNPQGAQPPTIEINGEQLKVTKSFTYLGSIVTNTCDLDKEITTRIARASAAYGRLNSRVWRSRDLRLKTKAAVYRATVIPVLTYCCETWTLYAVDWKPSTCAVSVKSPVLSGGTK